MTLRGRRSFLRDAAASVAVASGLTTAARASTATQDVLPDLPSIRKQGRLPLPYGRPSIFVKDVVRTPIPATAANPWFTPLQDLHGIITPNGLHYVNVHAGVPDIDPSAFRLLVHGLVERPLVLSLDDLSRFPAVSRIHFLECSGNGASDWAEGPGQTVQSTHGLLSCSNWTGVALSTIFAVTGLRPDAKWILAEGADGGSMTRSVPIEKALDDAVIVYAQNGEPLRPENGFPIRLFLPGFEGNMNVKWLRRIKVGKEPFYTRQETAKYTDLMPNGKADAFTFVMEAKSIITAPSGGQRLRGPGPYEIRGLAWSGHGKVTKVEVSTDDGATWNAAELQDPVLSKCLTAFGYRWTWNGAPARIASRCYDETGYLQPTHTELVKIRGVNSFYHYNGIHYWNVAADGGVTNGHG